MNPLKDQNISLHQPGCKGITQKLRSQNSFFWRNTCWKDMVPVDVSFRAASWNQPFKTKTTCWWSNLENTSESFNMFVFSRGNAVPLKSLTAIWTLHRCRFREMLTSKLQERCMFSLWIQRVCMGNGDLYWDILMDIWCIYIGIHILIIQMDSYWYCPWYWDIYIYMANYKMDTLMDPSVPCQEAKHLLRKCLDPQGQRS